MPKENANPTPAPDTEATPNTPAKSNGFDVLKRQVIGKAESDISALVAQGQVQVPEGYSVRNAMTFAWLMLQDVKDKDGRPALAVVSKSTIASALLRMVVMGLDPAKAQCYFIVYGKTLQCQRSYFGDMAILRRVRPGAEVQAGVVYEGDEFRYSMVPRRIIAHEQDLANVNPDRMVAAYAIITVGGEQIAAEVMTMDRIRKSWSKSKTYGNKNVRDKTHDDFPDEMAMRTVVRRAVKYLLNQSDDAHLRDANAQSGIDLAESALDDDVATYANAEVIDMEDGEDWGDTEEPAALEQLDNAAPTATTEASGQAVLVPNDEPDADF
jgi:recombination protein RecT